MPTPRQRQAEKRRAAAAAHKASPNGTGANTLSPEEMEELRQLLQPLVMQFKIAQGIIVGYLMKAGLKNVTYIIDFNTGLVTLTAPPVPEPVAVPPTSGSGSI